MARPWGYKCRYCQVESPESPQETSCKHMMFCRGCWQRWLGPGVTKACEDCGLLLNRYTDVKPFLNLGLAVPTALLASTAPGPDLPFQSNEPISVVENIWAPTVKELRNQVEELELEKHRLPAQNDLLEYVAGHMKALQEGRHDSIVFLRRNKVDLQPQVGEILKRIAQRYGPFRYQGDATSPSGTWEPSRTAPVPQPPLGVFLIDTDWNITCPVCMPPVAFLTGEPTKSELLNRVKELETELYEPRNLKHVLHIVMELLHMDLTKDGWIVFLRLDRDYYESYREIFSRG